MNVKKVLRVAGMLAVGVALSVGADDTKTPIYQIAAGGFHGMDSLGTRMLTYAKNVLTMRDAENGKEIRTFDATIGLRSMWFSRDEKRIITYNGQSIKLLDVESGKEISKISDNGIIEFRLSPDDKRIATKHKDGLKLWDMENGREIVTINKIDKVTIPYKFSPDGRRIVTAHKNSLKLWDSESGREIKTINDINPYFDQAPFTFSPNGKLMLTWYFNNKNVEKEYRGTSFQLWNTENGELIRTVHSLQGSLHIQGSACFSKDGKQVYTSLARNHMMKGAFRNGSYIWNAEPGNDIFIGGEKETSGLKILEGLYSHQVISPNGKYILATGFKDASKNVPPFWVMLFDADNPQKIMDLYLDNVTLFNSSTYGFSPDEKQIITEIPEIVNNNIVSYSIGRWDIDSKKQLNVFNVGKFRPHFNKTMTHAITKCDTYLDQNCDLTFKLWNVETGTSKTYSGHDKKSKDQTMSVFFSPCGTKLISSSGNEIKVWKL